MRYSDIMKNNKQIFFFYIVLSVVTFSLFSCGKSKNKLQVLSLIDSLKISSKHIPFTDSLPLLQSYYLSCSYPYIDSLAIMGYNFKTHALDIFSSVKVDRIQLEHHGINAIIGRPVSITPISKDSIWIYDKIAFYLINSEGKVLHKHKEEKNIFLDSNYAMHTAHIGWYDNDILLYPIDNNGRFFVEYYSLEKNKVIKEVALDFPDCNNNGKNSYADMKYPNVTFANNKVIYNYPYDSSVRTIDLSTGEKHEYEVNSQFAEKSLKPYKGSSSMENWLKYDWGNVHFYEVSYIPRLNLYVRFMLDGIDIDKHKDKQTIVDARKLYVTFMDKNFNLVGEFSLVDKRYSNFHGWCILSNAIIIYVDNLLGKTHEDLVFDVIIPISKKGTRKDIMKLDDNIQNKYISQ